jgi:hypothetical protein
LWRHDNLSVAFALLFLASWVGQLVTQWFNWANERHDLNQPLQIGSFLWQFWESTLENWQSEFLQPFSFVVLSAIFIHRAAPSRRTATSRCRKAWTASRSAWSSWKARSGAPPRAAESRSSMRSKRGHRCQRELPRP